MFCGAGSFAHDDDDGSPRSPSSPKGGRRKLQAGGNPYSTRGLETFSMVLADLESRKEKIMAKAGPQDVALVRFAYSDSKDWVPLIVRRRDRLPPEEEEVNTEKKLEAPDAVEEAIKAAAAAPPPAERAGGNRVVKKAFSWKIGEGEGGHMQQLRWRDSYYWPAVLVLILLCLAVSGRVFAICCTCAWWYAAAHAVKGAREGRNARRSMKKEYVRRMSDRRLGAGGNEVAGKRPVGAVDSPPSPRPHHAAAGKIRG